MEAHRERVRAENARALERAFERHREERAVLAREADAEEERLKARRAKALRAATREWGRRAEEEAARRLVSLAAGHQSPFRNGAANRARPKSKSKSKTNDRDDDGDDGQRVDDAAARAYGLGARRLGSPRGISNGADSNSASDLSPRPTRLPPGAYANADVLWRRSGTRKPESPEPPGSPSPGEYASIRSPCAAVHRSERSERSERASARGTSPGGSSEVFPPRIRTRRRRARFIKTWEAARICFGCRTPPEETTRFPPGTRFLDWTRFQPGAGTRGFPPGTRFLRGTGFPPGTGFPRRTRTRLDGSPSRVAARARTSSIRLLSVQFPPVPGSTPRFSTW